MPAPNPGNRALASFILENGSSQSLPRSRLYRNRTIERPFRRVIREADKAASPTDRDKAKRPEGPLGSPWGAVQGMHDPDALDCIYHSDLNRSPVRSISSAATAAIAKRPEGLRGLCPP